MENSAFRSPAEPDGTRKIRLSENYQKNRLCGVAPGRHGSQFGGHAAAMSAMARCRARLASPGSWFPLVRD